jgi:CheY-like chemotaxis protein
MQVSPQPPKETERASGKALTNAVTSRLPRKQRWRIVRRSEPMNAPRHTILVIDPDPSICALILALLRREGYAAEAAASPDEAILLHREGRYAAVIVDPRIQGGDSLLHALQLAGDGGGPTRKVIVVTTPENSQPTYAGHPGVHAVLHKPFFLTDLTEAVATCCATTYQAGLAR